MTAVNNSETDQGRRAAEAILGANPIIGVGRRQFAGAGARLLRMMSLKPATVARHQIALSRELLRISAGRSRIAPDASDRRFQDPVWQQNGYYRRWMQSWLLLTNTLNDIVDDVAVDADEQEKARFALNQFLEALAPTNHALGNPGFIANARQTRGRSLLRGLSNLVDDMLHNQGLPRQVDERPFKVGTNLACSAGRVVWRSPVCEVIQYGPLNEKVRETPILIIPSQINKYYIVDMAPGRSLVEFASTQGAQVFAVSWRNPTPRQRDWGLETYVEAARDAVDVVRDVAGADSVNLVAASAGGFTSAVLAGHLCATGAGHKINSLTLLMTVLDTSYKSLLGLFADRKSMDAAIAKSRAAGVLDGHEMARSFNWLRPGDLIWSYVANNYLLGEPPPASDVLYWNNDSTRLPAQFHADLLRLFRANPFCSGNVMRILGSDVDLKQIKVPVYLVGGEADHITPWQACFNSIRLFGGPVRFVLSRDGHVRSIVNPPSQQASYRTNDHFMGSADRWRGQSQSHRGSWWQDWMNWLQPISGDLRKAPENYGSARHSPGDPAPGRYIFQR